MRIQPEYREKGEIVVRYGDEIVAHIVPEVSHSTIDFRIVYDGRLKNMPSEHRSFPKQALKVIQTIMDERKSIEENKFIARQRLRDAVKEWDLNDRGG